MEYESVPASRPVSEEEHQALLTMLQDLPAEFDVYKDQLDGLWVEGTCKCGCGSIDLVVRNGAPIGSHGRAVIGDGYVEWNDGERGDVIVFVDKGQLSLLEFVVYHLDDTGSLTPVRFWTSQPRMLPSGSSGNPKSMGQDDGR